MILQCVFCIPLCLLLYGLNILLIVSFFFFSFNNIILSVFTLFLLILCCLCVFRVVWSSYLHVSFEMLFVISLLVCLYHLICTVFCLLGSIILLILSLCRPTIPVLVESKSTQTWQVASRVTPRFQ